MKVLLFADAGSVNVRSFSRGLERSGAEVVLATLVETENAVRLPGGPPAFGPLRYAIAGWRSRRLQQSHRADIVIGYFASGYGTVARLSRGRPLVQVVAGSDVQSMIDRPAARRWTATNLRAADLIIAWGDHLAEIVHEFGVPTSQILSIPRGVDLRRFRPPSNPITEHAIVSTRALAPKYQHDLVLRAFATLPDDVHLTLAGDGPAAPTLRTLAAELGIDSRVRFPGALRPDHVADLLRDHSIYVSASPSDGVSASLLEAMATGLVPVVADNAANRAWVTTGNGLLHDGSLAGLSAALSAAMQTPPDASAARTRRAVVEQRGDLSTNMRTIHRRLESLLG